jgi:hypothetical protein
MITAKIAPERPGMKALWLTTENTEEPDEGATYAITEEEIPAILEACMNWIIEHEPHNPDIKISKG